MSFEAFAPRNVMFEDVWVKGRKQLYPRFYRVDAIGDQLLVTRNS